MSARIFNRQPFQPIPWWIRFVLFFLPRRLEYDNDIEGPNAVVVYKIFQGRMYVIDATVVEKEEITRYPRKLPRAKPFSFEDDL